mmetsp:Transcript_1347/g.3809  ORF Transcript_1347/g.3809 Transcript_1347/m.3809 type:complete len:233 (+) Transcript_1347:180-878(+)
MAGQDVKSDALFAIGMAIMLLTPLLLAVCIAWCRFRSCHYTSTLTRAGASAHQQSKLLPELPKAATKTWRRVKCSRAGSPASSIATDSEDEEQALQPKRPGRRVARRAEERPSSVAKTLTSKMRRHGSAAMPFEWNHLTTIHFRRSDWAVQRRKPLSTKAGLHNISTLPVWHRCTHARCVLAGFPLIAGNSMCCAGTAPSIASLSTSSHRRRTCGTALITNIIITADCRAPR